MEKLPGEKAPGSQIDAVQAHSSQGHIVDEGKPSQAVYEFFRSLPEVSPMGGYLHPEQFMKVWGHLSREIEKRARSQGLPTSLKVNLDAIGHQLEGILDLSPTRVNQERLEYLVESTARYLVEVYHNCQPLESKYGPLKEIKATDGDPHRGKRPCFVTFAKTPPSKFGALGTWFTKPVESRFVYKPRNLAIEQAIMAPKVGLFDSLNDLCLKSGLFREPPLRTRTILSSDSFGFHEFVEGEYMDPKLYGGSYVWSKFAPTLLSKGFSDGAPFERYIFLEEVIKVCGLGSDAHFGNFIFNIDELYAEPIDLEVFDLSDIELSCMPSCETFVRIHREEELARLAPLLDEKRAIYREFLLTQGREAIEGFKRSIQNSPGAHIRYVPLNTFDFNFFLTVTPNATNFFLAVEEKLQRVFEQKGYRYFPSETFRAGIERCYRERNIPIFLKSGDGQFIYYEGEIIAKRKREQEE